MAVSKPQPMRRASHDTALQRVNRPLGRLDRSGPFGFGTHSLRRRKVALVYKRTGNIRACQLLLGHIKLESMVRYLGIEVDDSLIASEQTEI
ncbi:hypothetical protein [Methylobacterium radiodurans]|uniref:hypothetical protein n=1 Tax=Methylobacterium radiodurans TaxID=2202828 RepID=UPI003CCC4AB1